MIVLDELRPLVVINVGVAEHACLVVARNEDGDDAEGGILPQIGS